MLALALSMSLQAAAATATPPPAATPAAAPAPDAAPTPAQLERMRAKLASLGFPPGMEMPADPSPTVEQATIGPLFHHPFVCLEHPLGQLKGLGDALGTDCMMVGGLDGEQGYERLYRTDGKANSDWYGWQAEIHAPFDGVVIALVVNPVTNTPGTLGKPPASTIVFRRADGINVDYGHIMAPRVKVGDHVVMGQVVAIDGNNGMARAPHIHVGAWRGTQAYQIRWDSAAMGRIPALVGN